MYNLQNQAAMGDSLTDDDFDYFTDMRAKEEELNRLNEELDLQRLSITENLAEDEWCNTPARDKRPKNMTCSTARASGDDDDACHRKTKGTMRKRQPSNTTRNRDQYRSSHLPCSGSSPISTASVTSPQCTDNGMEEQGAHLDERIEGIGKNAMIRLQKARIKTLDSQLKEALRSKHEAEDTTSTLRLQLKESSQERKRLQKALAEAKSLAGKRKTEEKSTRTIMDDLKMELSQTKRELTTVQKSLKVAESEHNKREIRLSRALQEVEKYKQSVASRVTETRQDDEDVKREKGRLLANIKSLERQKAELLTAFKKQLKLIDILKRQKVHAEAAKLLQFTEEEFMKVIEWEA
uniref:Testis expressed 9 n=1 Tax=Odontella aurita TaxID=265563 RepID=A0A6U6JT90_9STRA|mmetsp:Transcript_55770/g.167126  ORF Transcript_55770/g.167126 Transcript_55770/m.167126 type:complete len:351 (+) Transcript_55770:2308-3360(+)|eukprot:CAMPEP_0113561544 /NCGR_PEP_ID=MMETSP0015_2-20120614/20035_1 /TAXON_ID=2838 /ORGANISM="Odontella" /LENGTH=350 /DNA_ID=CAMNT_0000463351 /DNA_START=820 /DNA_END=1872 /DNA_ORIENTATION=+ /assembly_acc=CAM_ASM_000160